MENPNLLKPNKYLCPPIVQIEFARSFWDEMPQKLTAKEENYCLQRMRGLTKSAAYRMAYDTSGMSVKTVWEKACRLDKKNNVRARLKQLHKEVVAGVIASSLDVLKTMTNILVNPKSKNVDKIRSGELLGRYLRLWTADEEDKPKDDFATKLQIEIINSKEEAQASLKKAENEGKVG